MHQEQIIIATVFAVIFTIAQLSSATPIQMENTINMPPICEPEILEEMPPHIKKVCTALVNSNKLSLALNQYIRNEASGDLFMKFTQFSNEKNNSNFYFST